MSTPTIEISVVSPVYGCASCLPALVDGIKAAIDEIGVAFEVILVDDGSPDGAWTAIQVLASTRPWLKGLRLSRNFGQHSAISAGLDATSGSWIVVMDCDLQDPPQAIPDLYRHAIDGQFDVVFAQRMDRQDSAKKRLSSWAFYRLLSWLTGVRQDERVANFGVFSRKVIDAVAAMPERDRAFPLMVRWVGFSQSAMPVSHAARSEGTTSYSFTRRLALALHIILGYSSKPLRMVASTGIACSAASFLMAAVAVYMYLAGEIAVAGYTSVVASIWLIGGLTLFCMGIVGLYVGQVFANVQGRPTSIVRESVGMVGGTMQPGRPPI